MILGKTIWGTSFGKEVPHTPQELPNRISKIKIVSLQIDSRRERNARFCFLKRLGPAKTLSAKKVVLLIIRFGNNRRLFLFLRFFFLFIYFCAIMKEQQSSTQKKNSFSPTFFASFVS